MSELLEQDPKIWEQIRAGVASIGSLVPATKILANFLKASASERKMRRLIEWAEGVDDALDDFEEKLDREYLETDEFRFLMTECFRGAYEHYQEEKLEAYKNVLINALVGGPGGAAEQEFFLAIVNDLSALHIRILALVKNPAKVLNEAGCDPDEQGTYMHFLARALPDVNAAVLPLILKEMERKELLMNAIHWYTSDTRERPMVDAAQGMKSHFGTLGNQLIHFISRADH